MGILQASSHPQSVTADLKALSELVESDHTPSESRVRALQWLSGLLQSQQGTEEGSGNTNEAIDSELLQAASSSQPESTAGVYDEAAKPESPPQEEDNLAHTPASLEVVSIATDAMLHAAVAKGAAIRAAAAASLAKYTTDRRFEMSARFASSSMAMAPERLCDLEPSVQHSWLQILSALVMRTKASILFYFT